MLLCVCVCHVLRLHVLCVCVVCVPQQLRMGLFLSGLNGNTGLSESAFPL